MFTTVTKYISCFILVVIGGATGVIIGMAVVFIVICVKIGRQRRTGKNQLGRFSMIPIFIFKI